MWNTFHVSLVIMGKGMLGIFTATLLIVFLVAALKKASDLLQSKRG